MRKIELRDEIVRCGRDPSYFINKYVKIRHPTRGLIHFSLFDYQDQLLVDYIENRMNVVLKGRQLGISELTAAFITWLIVFHPNQSVLVMATKSETAKNMVKKVRTAISHLPKWLLLSLPISDNKLSIELDNGSWVKAVSKSADAGRSEALSLLVIDEAAHIEGFDEIWTGLKPTVTAGGRIIMISTPNGVGNVFHQTFVDAESRANDYKATTLMWWVHPEHVVGLRDDPERPGFKTSPWYELETKGVSARERSQEYECGWLSSGDTFIAGEQLLWVETTLSMPVSIDGEDRGTLIYQNPAPGLRYLIAADVARGDGRDKSSAHVFEVDTMHQVAEYDGRTPPDRFAAILIELGHRYNGALLAIENNAVGIACLEHVKIIGYPNVFYTEKGSGGHGQAISTMYGTMNPNLVAGFTTSGKTRELMLNKLEELIRTRIMHIRSKRTYSEMQTFVWAGGRPEARSGANDDLVMAAALAAWIRDTFIKLNYFTADSQRAMLSGFSMQSHTNDQIHGASKDPTFAPRQSLGVFSRGSPADMYRMRVGQGRQQVDIDLRQLLDRPTNPRRR